MSTTYTFASNKSKRLTVDKYAHSYYNRKNPPSPASESANVTGIVNTGALYSVQNYQWEDPGVELCFGFPTPQNSIRYKKIESASFSFAGYYSYSSSSTYSSETYPPGWHRIYWFPAASEVDATTQQNIKIGDMFGDARPGNNLTTAKSTVSLSLSFQKDIKAALINGVIARFETAGNSNINIGYYVYTDKDSVKPTLSVTLSDDNRAMSAKYVSPSNGAYILPSEQIAFSCTLARDNAVSLYELQPSAGSLRYRAQGASSYTSIALAVADDRLTYSHTLSASSLGTGVYEYQFVFTINSGDTVTTDWKTINISDTTPSAPTIRAPGNEILSGNEPIDFSWTHNNASGLPASKSVIQIAANSAEYVDVITVDGSTSSYTLPADQLTSGKWKWRVRTYNSQNVAGAWAESSFTIVATPSTPEITITNATAMAAIRWTTSEQMAYQVEIDGAIVKTDFGSTNTYAVREHLKNNTTHIFRVRAQNTYGRWSQWGSASLMVQNSADPITFTAEAVNGHAELAWSSRECDYYRVYRDGICIAQLDYPAERYTDQTAIGRVTYEIRGVFEQYGRYDVSELVTIFVAPEVNRIRRLADETWLDLKLSSVQYKSDGISKTRKIQLIHMAGKVYQDVELSQQHSESMSVTCAFNPEDLEQMAALEALIGEVVILETVNGRGIIGVIDGINAEQQQFYTTYDFTITRINYSEDIING